MVTEEDFIGPDQVVDQLDTEVKRVADLFRFILKYKEQFQPSGIEFSDLRQYLVTDDASRIDWKNSAKSQDLFVKEYEEEKDMDVFIVVDVSDTMMFGTAEKLKAEYAALMASAISYASVDAGINVGIALYGENDTIITPDGGQVQYRRILHEVTDFDNYGGDFNLEVVLKDIIGQIKANTALFIISDFIDTEGEWKPQLKVCSEKFRHVMSIMLRDTRDYKLPDSGNIRFESVETGEQMVVNTDKARKQYEEEATKQEESVKERVRGGGSSFIKIDTRENFSAAFAEYFDEETEQW